MEAKIEALSLAFLSKYYNNTRQSPPLLFDMHVKCNFTIPAFIRQILHVLVMFSGRSFVLVRLSQYRHDYASRQAKGV